jgi:phosphate transport system substrate-binding protein
MKVKTLLILFLLFALYGCFYTYEERIRIDGSSTLFPLTEAVSEEFRKIESETKITIGVSGTGGGFKKLARNEIDIANASRGITEDEINLCLQNGVKFIELPVSYDGIVVVVHPDNQFVDYLSISELKLIWEPAAQGEILFWDQVRPGWPHKRLQLFGAGTSSGSFDYFTKAVVGIARASRGDYTASEDDNVLVQGVSGAKGALGYFGIAYYQENKNKMRAVPIVDDRRGGKTDPVFPTNDNITSGKYQPLARTEFLYVNLASAEKAAVQRFISFYLSEATSLETEISGVPLSPLAYKEAQRRFNLKITGTIFEANEIVGADLVELLQKANDENN